MQQKNPENPANTGGKGKLPGYPQDHDPAGTPKPKPESFPGKPPELYASDKKSSAQATEQPKRDQRSDNPDVNQPKRGDDEDRAMRPDRDKDDRQQTGGNRSNPKREESGNSDRGAGSHRK
jgi:hypothetical protein